jgi:hypothetical protein
MAKVYVSSTVADLAPERRAVMDWLVAARHQPVHSYLPSSETVRDSVLDDVDTCDLYVLILGHRYGFVPEDGNPEGLSITQLEFRRAGQSGIPRIALLRTGAPGSGLSGMEDPQKAASVAAFRAEVTREVRAAEFSDLPGLIQGLSTGVQAELDKLPPAGRVLRLAPRPPFLAGREDLLADLDARLADGDGWEPRLVALHGMAGAGKTSLALAYAHTHLAGAGITWQFAAEDAAVLAAGFAELAVALGAQQAGVDPVVAVHGVLATSRAGWLLIFDNAPSPQAVEALLPPAGRGRVLITSRDALWPGVQAVEVPALGLDAAAGFLVARTGDADRQAATGLAQAVGGLPLALEQAAAYIQASDESLASYLALFRQRRPQLLARGQPTGYDSTVAATWSLAFTQLEHSSTAAVKLLWLLSCYAPDAIPFRLLLQPPAWLPRLVRWEVALALRPLLDNPLAVNDAVAVLRRYSLVTPAGDGLVSVHRLVQAVTLDQLSARVRAALRATAATLIEAAIPTDTDKPETWPVVALLLPHVQVALADDHAALWRLASYLGERGSYLAALELERRYVEGLEQSRGAEHPDTLTARGNLAHWTGMTGDAAGARDQYAALLPVRERVLGPEHPDTLAAHENLAAWTGHAGDMAGARDQYAELLPVVERVLGPEHPLALRTRANLADFTGTAGDAAGARDQTAALLPTYERVLGPEHPDTLSARANLAAFTGEAGDAASARDQLAELLPIEERVVGPESPATLAHRATLARFTGEAGNAASALDQLAELLPIQERVVGPEHPHTLTTRGYLARFTGEAGDAAGARDQYAALLPIIERVLGPGHPETLTDRNLLAHWTEEANHAGN